VKYGCEVDLHNCVTTNEIVFIYNDKTIYMSAETYIVLRGVYSRTLKTWYRKRLA